MAGVKELKQNYNVAIDKIKELNIPALEAAMEGGMCECSGPG